MLREYESSPEWLQPPRSAGYSSRVLPGKARVSVVLGEGRRLQRASLPSVLSRHTGPHCNPTPWGLPMARATAPDCGVGRPHRRRAHWQGSAQDAESRYSTLTGAHGPRPLSPFPPSSLSSPIHQWDSSPPPADPRCGPPRNWDAAALCFCASPTLNDQFDQIRHHVVVPPPPGAVWLW